MKTDKEDLIIILLICILAEVSRSDFMAGVWVVVAIVLAVDEFRQLLNDRFSRTADKVDKDYEDPRSGIPLK